MALQCERAHTGPGSHKRVGLGVPLAAILPPLPRGGAQKPAISIHAFLVILRQVTTLGEIPVQLSVLLPSFVFHCLICCSDSPAKSELITQITGKERGSERQVCCPRSHSQQGARSGSEPGLRTPKPEPLTAGCHGATSLVSICLWLSHSPAQPCHLHCCFPLQLLIRPCRPSCFLQVDWLPPLLLDGTFLAFTFLSPPLPPEGIGIGVGQWQKSGRRSSEAPASLAWPGPPLCGGPMPAAGAHARSALPLFTDSRNRGLQGRVSIPMD